MANAGFDGSFPRHFSTPTVVSKYAFCTRYKMPSTSRSSKYVKPVSVASYSTPGYVLCMSTSIYARPSYVDFDLYQLRGRGRFHRRLLPPIGRRALLRAVCCVASQGQAGQCIATLKRRPSQPLRLVRIACQAHKSDERRSTRSPEFAPVRVVESSRRDRNFAQPPDLTTHVLQVSRLGLCYAFRTRDFCKVLLQARSWDWASRS